MLHKGDLMVSKRGDTVEAVQKVITVRQMVVRQSVGLIVATCCATAVTAFIPTLLELPGALVHAEPRSEDLKEGDTPGDVLRVWGEPVERVQKGLQGAVVWYYPRGTSVTFEQGRVREWHVEGRRDVLPTPTGAAGTPGAVTPTVAAVVTTKIKQETRDLLREIAKEVPSSPDSPSSSIDVVIPPPPPIQQPPPPPPPAPIQQPELLPQVLGQPEPGLVPGQIQPLGAGGGDLVMED